MNAKEKLTTICTEALQAKNLDERYAKRLKDELREIDAQNEFEYFLDLADKKTRYAVNQNNLLVPWLLGVVNEFKVDEDPTFTYGEFPDIDIDYIDVIRDYLKHEWAPKKFGADRVCNIGNYATFGIKGAFQDMARVHDKSRSEIVDLTTKLGLKDDEGKVLTFDKALEMYPELKKYCEENEDVAKAVNKLLHRNRGMGKHAGGLIIANGPIEKFIPLVKNPKDDMISSAWVEGLHAQDLGPVGLIKFDLLVIKDLERIAMASNFVKKRHGLESMCALPGQWDWSDLAYKNDEKSLDMAKKGDLLGVFQFDSQQIRAMVRRGGVDSFDDLVAYNALYRPGPLGMKMHERYIERKRGREDYEIHPLMEPFLYKTYGVLIYQEQVMQVLHAVGDIPLKDCYIVIKAVAKKKIKLFKPYKEMFLTNGQKNLGWTYEQVLDLWNQIESFAEYGFNKSHATAYVYIACRCLKLKAHWPLEFYAATLRCETVSEKMKEYKTEAEQHGVPVHPVLLNRSKEKFDIVDDEICFGFSNVKGIGEAVAERIVAGQPYAGFQDFLGRFGTDAEVVQALIGLRVFKDSDPVTLYKYYEFFKDKTKKRGDRKKRFSKTVQKLYERLKFLLGPAQEDYAEFKEEYFQKWEKVFDVDETIEVEEEVEETLFSSIDGVDPVTVKKKVMVQKQFNRWKELKKLWNSYQRSIKGDETKTAAEEENKLSLVNFNPDEYTLDDELIKLLRDEKECERTYYGFQWRTRLEESPDYTGGHTFERFKTEIEANGAGVFSVEVEIEKEELRTSKKNKSFTYHQLTVTDANGERGFITVWNDDWERWAPEMVKGNLLKIRVMAPQPPHKTYTFESPPRHKRYTLPRDKNQDYRLLVMAPPVEKKDERLQMTDDEIMAQLDNCKMED